MTETRVAGDHAGDLFSAIDAKDATAFVSFLTDDAVFRFGASPPVQGRATIQVTVDGFFDTIAGCTHALRRSIRDGAVLVCEGEVTYRRHNGTQITLPFTDVMEYDGDLIAHYKIYMDINPLYAE